MYGDQSGEFVCGQLGSYKGLRSTYKLFEGGVHVSFFSIYYIHIEITGDP